MKHAVSSVQPNVLAYKRLASAAVLLFVCAGCSTVPNTVARPVVQLKSGQANGIRADYLVNDKVITYGTDTSIIPIETTVIGVKNQVVAFHAAYENRRRALLAEVDTFRNIQFLGSVAAAVGIAANEVKLRNQGAGAAGLATVFQSQYAAASQAANYATAASAMECVYNQVNTVDPNFLNAAYDKNSGRFFVNQQDFTTALGDSLEISAGYSTLMELFPTIHRAIQQIDQKLQNLQSSVTPAVLSATEIQEMVTRQVKAQKTNEATEKQIAAKAHGLISGTAKTFADYFGSGAVSAALALPSKLDTCVTGMGK